MTTANITPLQLKEILDNALNERVTQWDLMVRLGIPDVPKIGFPCLGDINIKTIHEGYQFLAHWYIEGVKKTNKNSRIKRRNSCKAKIDHGDKTDKGKYSV